MKGTYITVTQLRFISLILTDTDSGSYNPAATDQEVLTGCASTLSTDYEGSEYQVPPLLSFSLATAGHISPIPFGIHQSACRPILRN